jgi:hypothetical protein
MREVLLRDETSALGIMEGNRVRENVGQQVCGQRFGWVVKRDDTGGLNKISV